MSYTASSHQCRHDRDALYASSMLLGILYRVALLMRQSSLHRRCPARLLALILALLGLFPSAPGTATAPGSPLLEPFDYRGVTLGDGPLLRQVLEVREDYLRLPNDDLLKPFRERAGKPAPGVNLGGWYSDGIFHVFGQILSGLARMHAATGDEACRLKLDALIEGWKECIEDDGYFFSSRPPRPAHYIYEKTVGGLLDAHRYGGNPEALRLLDRITTWAERNLDHSNDYLFDTLTGISEWYTLSENLYRAAQLTGESRYRDYARTWEYTRFWKLFDEPAGDPGPDLFAFSRGYHAYSHVNSLNGAVAAYGITGEGRYLKLVRNAYDYLQRQQIYATGGYGPNERLVPEPLLLDYLDVMENHWETACSSWAGFKLGKQLMRFTGDARYGDWIERLLINGIGAALPMAPDGRVMYHSGHGLSGTAKSYKLPPWSCCAGSRVQAVADYHDLIFFQDTDSLYVNLYTPAVATWSHRGRPVTLRQETQFPESEYVQMRLSLADADTFTLKLRQPAWLAQPMEMRINGQAARPEIDAAHWASLRREWRDGDRLELRLPMRFAAERFPYASTNAFPAAIVRGPVVLAGRAAEGNPVSRINFADLQSNFLPVTGEPMSFRLKSDSNVLFRPFYRFKQGERYFMYFNPRHPWTRRLPSELKFSSGWNMNLTDDLQTTTNVGAFVEHTFTGRQIRWIGRMFDDAGRAEVRLDGQVIATVDQYAPVRDTPFRYEINNLPEGPHTLRLTLLADPHPASKNRRLNVAGFDVVSPLTAERNHAHDPE